MAKQKENKVNRYVALDDVWINGVYVREGQTMDFIEGQEPKPKKGRPEHFLLLKKDVGSTDSETLDEDGLKLKGLVAELKLGDSVLETIYGEADAKSTTEKLAALEDFQKANSGDGGKKKDDSGDGGKKKDDSGDGGDN